jgi:hypothetical protein
MKAKARVVASSIADDYRLFAAHAVMGLIAIVLASLTVAAAERSLAPGASLSVIEAAALTARAAPDQAPPALPRH